MSDSTELAQRMLLALGTNVPGLLLILAHHLRAAALGGGALPREVLR